MNGRFRVWDGEEMHEPPHEYIYDPREGARRVIDASDGRLTCSQPVDGEVLWGTGLTDAEGAEVYEGDLLEYEGEIIGLVQYQAESGGWACSATPLMRDAFDLGVTVIGNRYEDPALLDEPTS